MALITRNSLFYKSLFVPIHYRRISHIVQHEIPNNQDSSENSSKNGGDLKPPQKNEQTISSTTDELAHIHTSYDPKIVDPLQNGEKRDDRNPLEWSAANRSISKHTDKRGNQPV
ncbi:10409_t:CDS:2 [Ambispora leptoticha]|uniref:10409_t:CDS:1 n=1 Tax=Ambispora leptoticha TaxID=144679 RepID=A0A9N9HM81_9GLOM|nr:10409_t:CDS:2 [Ambispora leptoticha]